jgi:hypothetical protein
MTGFVKCGIRDFHVMPLSSYEIVQNRWRESRNVLKNINAILPNFDSDILIWVKFDTTYIGTFLVSA